MSDPNAAPDPVDKAYAEAEAVLSDEAARAERRARVLAAVAREGAPEGPAPPLRSPLWRPGGWLVAASVSALAVFLAVQVYRPPTPPQTQPAAAPTVAKTAAPAAPDNSVIAAPTSGVPPSPTARGAPATPTAKAQPQSAPIVATEEPAQPPQASAPRAADSAAARAESQAAPPTVAMREARAAPPPPAPPPPPPAPAAPASRPASALGGAQAEAAGKAQGEVVVTAEKREQRLQQVPLAITVFTAPQRDEAADPGAQLRAAAAAGRTSEVQALLERDAPVDAADANGDTALMKSIEADHPAAAAALRHYGASLEKKNKAGESAKDMAKAAADPALDKALGLDR